MHETSLGKRNTSEDDPVLFWFDSHCCYGKTTRTKGSLPPAAADAAAAAAPAAPAVAAELGQPAFAPFQTTSVEDNQYMIGVNSSGRQSEENTKCYLTLLTLDIRQPS